MSNLKSTLQALTPDFDTNPKSKLQALNVNYKLPTLNPNNVNVLALRSSSFA